MRIVVHVARMLWESFRFGLATRKMSVVAVIALGLLLLAVTLTAQAVAPLALYPFA